MPRWNHVAAPDLGFPPASLDGDHFSAFVSAAAAYSSSVVQGATDRTSIVSSASDVLSGSGYRWGSPAVLPSGVAYACPHSARSILRIDTAGGTATAFGYLDDSWNSNGGTSTFGKFYSCIASPQGNVYGIPGYSPKVIRIDPADDSFASIATIPSLQNYGPGVVGGDGRIYAFNGSTVLVIDPATDSVSRPSISSTVSLTGGGPCLGPGGDLYVIRSTDVRRYDVSSGTAEVMLVLPEPCGSTQMSRTVLAANGRMYALPGNAVAGTTVYRSVEYDPVTNTAVQWTSGDRSAGKGWMPSQTSFSTSSGCLLPGGLILFPYYYQWLRVTGTDLTTETSRCLILDPINRSFPYLTTGPVLGTWGSSQGGVVGADGRVYVAPMGGTLTSVPVVAGAATPPPAVGFYASRYR